MVLTGNYKVVADCKGMYEEEIINTVMKNRNIKDMEHFINPVEDDLLPLEALPV